MPLPADRVSPQDAFNGLPNLRRLSLRHTLLAGMALNESTFAGLARLRALDLSHTPLEALQGDVFAASVHSENLRSVG